MSSNETPANGMHAFHEFFDHMSSQLPETFFGEAGDTQLEHAEHSAEHAALLRAAYLWSLLDIVNDDLNSLCRRNPGGILGPNSVAAINKAFAEVRTLITNGGERICTLDKLDEQNPVAHADALTMVALHRAALRQYRIEVLNEDLYGTI
jgi:hypothetical protein